MNNKFELIKIDLEDLVPIENAVCDVVTKVSGSAFIPGKEGISYSSDEVRNIFEICNVLPELGALNCKISKQMGDKNGEVYVNWGYPNFRIDTINRTDYMAPPHLDEWISFKKNGIVIWLPLFEQGHLDLAIGTRNFEIQKDEYWGLKAVGELEFESKCVMRGEALLFGSELLHKSNDKNWNPSGIRMSVQYRIEPVDFDKSFQRVITQTITDVVRRKQAELQKNNA